MGKWHKMYQNLTQSGLDVEAQLAGTSWLNRFIPYFGKVDGRMLDLGCGLGADMLRCAKLGYEPYGLDLEMKAVEAVTTRYGFHAQKHDFGQPLPFEDGFFSLVLSRFALHYLKPIEAQALYAEIGRVLKPGGQFLFVVNSESHRQLKLQYNYTDAAELEPYLWHLPHDKDRTFLFYTPRLTKQLLGQGWHWHHLADEPFEHWSGIKKRVILGLAQKSPE